MWLKLTLVCCVIVVQTVRDADSAATPTSDGEYLRATYRPILFTTFGFSPHRHSARCGLFLYTRLGVPQRSVRVCHTGYPIPEITV